MNLRVGNLGPQRVILEGASRLRPREVISLREPSAMHFVLARFQPPIVHITGHIESISDMQGVFWVLILLRLEGEFLGHRGIRIQPPLGLVHLGKIAVEIGRFFLFGIYMIE